MKKLSTLFALLILIALTIHAQSWNFTSVKDADIANIQADIAAQKGTWVHNTSDGKDLYGSLTKHEKEAVTANNVELEYTKGLLFTYGSSTGDGTLRIDKGKSRMWFGNGSITIPNLTAGLVVTVNYMSSSKDVARGISVTNLTATSGKFGQNVKGGSSTSDAITSEGTVTADGEVTLTMTSSSETSFGMYIYSIKITDPSATPEPGTDPVSDDYSVLSNAMKNQAIITLNTNERKYYNTASLQSIDFSGNNVTMNLGSNQTYTFSGNVADISFKKAEINSGDIDNPTGAVEITEARGWLESAYIKFNKFDGAKTYNVYVKGGQYADYTQIDPQLVREYPTYGRADVVGLQAGNYSIKIEPVGDENTVLATASEATGIEVKNYSREGFAHKDFANVGAYNDDGTLKTNAKVLYITKHNFNTITLDIVTDSKKGTKQTFTGLGKIFAAKQKGTDNTPLAVRIIGEIDYASTDKEQRLSDEDGLQLKGNSETTEMNVTLEGIGEDATFNGFGMTFYNGVGVEMRNIGLINFKDDGIQLKGTQHAWIHHCDFFYGNAGSAADQAKGDGSLDVKDDSRYCTFSYNHFWDSGKTSLCGMKSESGPNYICYHHNWFDHSDSRHPRVRSMSVHVWNNYYDGVAKLGACAVKGANLFVEANYFRNSKNPMMISEQGTDGRDGFADDHEGGMIKAFGNILTGKSLKTFIPHTTDAVEFDAYVATTRDEKVPDTYKCVVGNHPYNNFDTDATLMYSYNPDDADMVPAVVTGWYGAGRMNHGDLQWTFSSDDDDKDAIDADLKAKVTSYKSSLIGIFGDENTGGEEQGGDDPQPGGDDPVIPEETITATFDGAPSNSMFTAAGDYGDGKATYKGTYVKKGLKLNSKGSITFTPARKYNMTIVLGTAKSATDVKLNGTLTTVSGTANTEGKYYELQPIAISANTEYVISQGSAEGLVMFIVLEPTK